MKMLKNVMGEVTVTPLDMANLFWEQMDSREQALFFNALGHHVDIVDFANQMQSLTDDPALAEHGRKIMSIIGEYSENKKD